MTPLRIKGESNDEDSFEENEGSGYDDYYDLEDYDDYDEIDEVKNAEKIHTNLLNFFL